MRHVLAFTKERMQRLYARLNLERPTLLRQQAYVNGLWCGADSAALQAVSNPSTGLEIASVPLMGALEAARAIDAANTAWLAWRRKTGMKRATLLRKWHDLILHNIDDLDVIMTSEQGKPLAEARSEVSNGAAYIEWFSEEAKRVSGETLASPWPDRRLLVTKEPIGVCAAITPWNFPLAMITRKPLSPKRPRQWLWRSKRRLPPWRRCFD